MKTSLQKTLSKWKVTAQVEKIHASHVVCAIKDLYPEHKNNSQNSVTKNFKIRKRAKGLNRHFTKENIGMT